MSEDIVSQHETAEFAAAPKIEIYLSSSAASEDRCEGRAAEGSCIEGNAVTVAKFASRSLPLGVRWREVLEHLPSSSVPAAKSSSNRTFGEILVDIVWTIDAELEDILADAKSFAGADSANPDVDSADRDAVTKVLRAKEKTESEKETLVKLVKRLLGDLRQEVDPYKDGSLNKFNLLREQSEGYSKLVTELTSSLGPPHSPETGRPTESLAARY
ncbi:hypothetical protein WOLCODRAFT_159437 [Wolfiporia cocos MD-104 SS10]|uniref:THO complex subunit 2 N-terminal domain-containing protein n=1 Tax=Wolfiporia cocos (strain MD-104) TaxID=742152 RepID=A0A2H3IYY7_WOLCO|nr:hypothetical protein WOLCODRAFT_159437 [Wolfiporia cocos MD-104 SS10]